MDNAIPTSFITNNPKPEAVKAKQVEQVKEATEEYESLEEALTS